MTATHNDTETSLTDLNSETAIIKFTGLIRFFAQGRVLLLDDDMDLVNTAHLFAKDDAASIEILLTEDKLKVPSDEQAKQWIDNDDEVWAVVVAPWVLTQQLKAE